MTNNLTPDTTPDQWGLTPSGFCACGMEDRECEGDNPECPDEILDPLDVHTFCPSFCRNAIHRRT